MDLFSEIYTKSRSTQAYRVDAFWVNSCGITPLFVNVHRINCPWVHCSKHSFFSDFVFRKNTPFGDTSDEWSNMTSSFLVRMNMCLGPPGLHRLGIWKWYNPKMISQHQLIHSCVFSGLLPNRPNSVWLRNQHVRLITFKGFVYSWSQAINFVNEKTNPLKVIKTVKTNSGLWFQC